MRSKSQPCQSCMMSQYLPFNGWHASSGFFHPTGCTTLLSACLMVLLSLSQTPLGHPMKVINIAFYCLIMLSTRRISKFFGSRCSTFPLIKKVGEWFRTEQIRLGLVYRLKVFQLTKKCLTDKRTTINTNATAFSFKRSLKGRAYWSADQHTKENSARP